MLTAEMRPAGDGRAEALQLLGLAEQLLGARDLARSRAFAERAVEADPLLDGPDRVLAAVDVLLAAQRRRINNHVDWYAVLQLDAASASAAASPSAVRLQYRRLALLLRPDPHRGSLNLFFPSSSASSSAAATDEAFRLVCEAWAVLSDPVKKELYDREIEIAASADAANQRPDGSQNIGEGAGKKGSAEAEIDAGASFWTACTGCCHIFQYARGYEEQSLLCQNCGRAFQAAEMASPPPVVPGMEMYFCSWGLFPLGFPGGPKFACPSDPKSAKGRQLGRVGRRKKDDSDVDEDWEPRSARKKQNKRSLGAKKGKANGRLVNANDVSSKATGMPSAAERSPRKTRTKVMAKRGRKQVAGAEESGAVDSGEAQVDVDLANKGDGGIQQEADTKADGMRNPQKAGCSRTVEVSMEDLNLNFAIDVNAAAAIIESMGNDPGYNNLRWFEDCFRGTFNP